MGLIPRPNGCGLKDRFTRRGSQRRAARLERTRPVPRHLAYEPKDMDSKIHRDPAVQSASSAA
jgi:hypothetical protein